MFILDAVLIFSLNPRPPQRKISPYNAISTKIKILVPSDNAFLQILLPTTRTPPHLS